MLRCIGYVSNAANILGQNDLNKILEVSTDWNLDHNISGILCYHDGSFLQFLEGDSHEVEYIFKRIVKDPRHTCITKVLDEPIAARLFKGWGMAVRNVGDIPADLQPACHQLMCAWVPNDAAAPPHKHDVHAFLSAFRDSLR